MATLHCLLGCIVGEMIGVTIGTHLGWQPHMTITLAVILSFVSGYAFSTWPLLQHGMQFWPALKLVLLADTFSILAMTIADNSLMLLIPGAMDKDLANPMYWISRGSAVIIAFVVAYPVNKAQIARGRGHALTHQHMAHGHSDLAKDDGE